MMGGLEERTLEIIRHYLAQYPGIKEAIIFGSRAKGNYRNGSDIDLSLKTDGTFDFNALSRLANDFDDSDLPYFFDLNMYNKLQNDALKEHIDRVGLTLYEQS